MRSYFVVVALLGTTACGGQELSTEQADGGATPTSSLDAGSSRADGGSTSLDASAAVEAGVAVDGPSPASIDGVWTGAIDGYQFMSGSNAMVMTLALTGTTVTGTIVFGNPALAPPPATDPNVGYPTDVNFVPLLNEGPLALNFFGEGHSFPITGGTFDGTTLQVGFDPDSMYATWCSLQTSYPNQTAVNSRVAYSCVPSADFVQNGNSCSWTDTTTGVDTPVDCGKLFLCVYDWCYCDQTSCLTPAPLNPNGTLMTMRVAGTEADGTTDVFRANIDDPSNAIHFIHTM